MEAQAEGAALVYKRQHPLDVSLRLLPSVAELVSGTRKDTQPLWPQAKLQWYPEGIPDSSPTL